MHFWVQIETVGDNGRLPTHGGKNQPAPHDLRHDGQALVLMTCEHTRVLRTGLPLGR